MENTKFIFEYSLIGAVSFLAMMYTKQSFDYHM